MNWEKIDDKKTMQTKEDQMWVLWLVVMFCCLPFVSPYTSENKGNNDVGRIYISTEVIGEGGTNAHSSSVHMEHSCRPTDAKNAITMLLYDVTNEEMDEAS